MLFPAIDLRGGRCVRLYQGDYGRETAYDVDPVRVAVGFAEEGARWIHVVDLDAARTGTPENRVTVAAIAAAVGPDVSVQVGGGVRDRVAVEELLAAGAARVVMGTVAVEDPDLVRALAAQYPVVVGLDARDGDVAVRGWTEATGRGVDQLAAAYADSGVAAIVVTDIGRDGTLTGPSTGRLADVLLATVAATTGSVDVIASGGVGALSDLKELARLEVAGQRLAGVIVGKAIHEGVFTVREAIAACAASA